MGEYVDFYWDKCRGLVAYSCVFVCHNSHKIDEKRECSQDKISETLFTEGYKMDTSVCSKTINKSCEICFFLCMCVILFNCKKISFKHSCIATSWFNIKFWICSYSCLLLKAFDHTKKKILFKVFIVKGPHENLFSFIL